MGSVHLPSAITPDETDNQRDDSAEDRQWDPKKPCRLRNAVAMDGSGLRRVNRPDYGNHIVSDGSIFAKTDRAEKVYNIMFNAGVVAHTYTAEKVDHVMICMARDVDASEEDNNIVVRDALDVDAAKETDSIMDRRALGHVDVAAELHCIAVCMSGGGNKCKSRKEQSTGEDGS